LFCSGPRLLARKKVCPGADQAPLEFSKKEVQGDGAGLAQQGTNQVGELAAVKPGPTNPKYAEFFLNQQAAGPKGIDSYPIAIEGLARFLMRARVLKAPAMLL